MSGERTGRAMPAHLRRALTLLSVVVGLGCGGSSVEPAEPSASLDREARDGTASPSEGATQPVAEGAPVPVPVDAPTPRRLGGAGHESSPSFLWEARPPEGGPASYLLGTTHVSVTMEQALPAPHLQHLDEARLLMVEADPSELDPMAAQARMRLPGSASLDRLLSDRAYAALKQRLDGKIPMPVARQLAPWAVSVMLLQSMVAALHDGDPPKPMDLAILRRARADATPVVFFEEALEQLEILSAVPMETQVAQLEELVLEPDQASEELSSLLAAYRSGDRARVERLLFDPEELERFPKYYEAVFFARNEAWLPRIARAIRGDGAGGAREATGGAFIAVGLGHLVGERGLVRALERRGFDVRRVR